MNDDPRDELDRALSSGLSGLASGGENADTVLAGMRPQLRRARTRYRATRIGSAALIVLLAAGGIALLAPHGKTTKLKVIAKPTTVAPVTTAPVAPRRHHRGAVTTTTRPLVTQTIPARLPVATVTGPAVAVPTPPTSIERTDHAPAPVTTTTVAKVPVIKTYSVEGGHLTVRFANGKLTVVSYKADSGWTVTFDKQEPTDIEVRFDYGESESIIRVRVENGQLKVTTDE
jgi:hypothetical protein